MKYSNDKTRLFLLLLPLLLLTLPLRSQEQAIRVACVGNSITYGYTLPHPATQSYPAQLQRLLGERYSVGNFGKSGATLLKSGHRPYTQQQEYRNAIAFAPQVVVIHLGVNDTDPRDWPHYGDSFVSDYLSLIEDFRRVNPHVRVIIARLTPISATHARFRTGTRDWRLLIQQCIEQVAQIAGAELIDFDAPLRDRQNLMPDGVHPNVEGSALLAETVYGAITGHYGGLQMPPLYTHGMVLQRDRPLTLGGRADTGAHITLTIGGHTRTAVADNRGDWSVTVPPLTADREYTLVVSDGERTLRYEQLLAGEVWLCSGQSNMAFQLRASARGADFVAASSDSALRIFDMRPIAETDNRRWNDTVISAVDRLQYFAPATWQAASPRTTASVSAVAYHFAKALRDSLGVPVGLICNAVGGAPAEAWIDVNSLERSMPEALINWRRNDYVQPWAQGRADVNTGTERPHRHPYEPAYLFAAGIRPLGKTALAGVLWYQGESNAHNTELHEQLFPLWVESWRRWFGDEQLPVCFAQLSSIARPSWPLFRDSQRRMADALPGVMMAVTSDVGDSLDVHPRDKQPVGNRLARQALHNLYRFKELTPCGPSPVEAVSRDGAVWLAMQWGSAMQSADGGELRTFELAGSDGLYHPARAQVCGDGMLKIESPQVAQPRYVRYGWQPFTRANLVNGDGLPASTFKMEVSNCDLFAHEPGIEQGVSAAYAARIDTLLLVAGGCNFPDRPLGEASSKRFYSGIYVASANCPDDSLPRWRKVGALPQAAAYGVAVATPQGVVLLGGIGPQGALDRVWRLTLGEGGAHFDSLPSLPFKIDNAAAAAIGSKIYVAGGNCDGLPSTRLLMLDLEAPGQGWKSLRSLPGNPRTQPVMAAATAPDGEQSLYLWGGFAPTAAKRQATLETGGLLYTPSKNRWRSLPAPLDEEGAPLSLGGAAICPLDDGTLAVAGGVNREVFLAALRNQPPRYLEHPAEWYRFNGTLLRYHPQSGEWSRHGTLPAAARAGAVLLPGNRLQAFLAGGELKPRVRTAEVTRLDFK